MCNGPGILAGDLKCFPGSYRRKYKNNAWFGKPFLLTHKTFSPWNIGSVDKSIGMKTKIFFCSGREIQEIQ